MYLVLIFQLVKGHFFDKNSLLNATKFLKQRLINGGDKKGGGNGTYQHRLFHIKQFLHYKHFAHITTAKFNH